MPSSLFLSKDGNLWYDQIIIEKPPPRPIQPETSKNNWEKTKSQNQQGNLEFEELNWKWRVVGLQFPRNNFYENQPKNESNEK